MALMSMALAFTASVLLLACANASGSVDVDAGSQCQSEDDCRPGYACVGGQCVLPSDAGTGDDSGQQGHPAILVEPRSLVFDQATLGIPETKAVTVSNMGEGNLVLESFDLTENDPTIEYSFQEPAHTTLGPGDVVEIEITLAPVDGQIDSGELIIQCNDPVSPSITVALSASWVGTPDLEVCVLTGDPLPGGCEDPMVVDMGTVPYGTVANRRFSLWNGGTGNRVIRLDEIAVACSAPSHDPLYNVELFKMVENPPGSGNWQEQPATLPVDLVPTTAMDDNPDALYGRVSFTADTDGFLVLAGDHLSITASEPEDPTPQETAVPITGAIDGCPPGLHDINGNPADGCEYACTVSNGGVERCDNMDNDCDGTVDGFSEACYDAGDGGCNPDGTGCQGTCQAGTRECMAGIWSACQGQVAAEPEQCDDLDNDCDGVINNGLDEGGDGCGSASIGRPARPEDGSADTITGTITDGDDDWYVIHFQDDAGYPDAFDARVAITAPSGGGNFRMDIYRDACNTPMTCGPGSSPGVTSALNVVSFSFNAAGENGCTDDSSCKDHSMTLYIRVYRVGGPLCEEYTIRASNG